MLPSVKEPIIPFAPPHYLCKRSGMLYKGEPDGNLEKPFWQQAKFIEDFHDIEGDELPRPAKKTRVKMLWDDNYLYVGALLEDDEIWATVKERDEIVYVDNDFEVFLSPKHTSHRYYEFEINAMNTVWDLMMEKPNRDGVHRIIAWDARDLKTAVHIEGELNNPQANNQYWSIEMLIPWFPLRECEIDECRPSHIVPDRGEVWRLNFSRVQHRVKEKNGRYVKRINAETGKPYPEDNWVWAPTGVIDIHMPEMWGYLVFVEDDDTVFTPPVDEAIAWELRKLYYRQRNFGANNSEYTTDFEKLRGQDKWTINPKIDVTPHMFEMSAPSANGRLYIRQDGYLWEEVSDETTAQ